jgi:hypothetical protein
LGQHEQARQLAEDTLIRCRRILGNDHPDTLNTANILAVTQRQSGQHEQIPQPAEDKVNPYSRQ